MLANDPQECCKQATENFTQARRSGLLYACLRVGQGQNYHICDAADRHDIIITH